MDATLGRGGHSQGICNVIAKSGLLAAVDQDEEALGRVGQQLEGGSCQTVLIHGNFRDLDKLLDERKIWKLDAALFDLGMSLEQIKESGRGFTFERDEPLVMNFKKNLEPADLTAQEVVNKWSQQSLTDILFGFGGETFSRQIAAKVIEARERKSIETTKQLVEIIRQAIPDWYARERIHFATRTFQAIRMAVNDEVGSLRNGLEKAWLRLNPGGRIAVISFHSVEDRIVKHFFKQKEGESQAEIVTKKPTTPTDAEIKNNPRSRSAKLRVAQKINKTVR